MEEKPEHAAETQWSPGQHGNSTQYHRPRLNLGLWNCPAATPAVQLFTIHVLPIDCSSKLNCLPNPI